MKNNLLKLIDIDFESRIVKKENGSYLENSSDKLLSPTSIIDFFKPFKSEFIDPNVLVKSRVLGKLIHLGIQEKRDINQQDLENDNEFWFLEKNQYQDIINDANIAIKECINVLKEKKIKILVNEKCVINQNGYGFIDCLGHLKYGNSQTLLIDIKTSSNNQIKKEWLFQLAYYELLLNGINQQTYILLWNKKTKKAELIQIDRKQLTPIKKAIKTLMEFFYKGEFEKWKFME